MFSGHRKRDINRRLHFFYDRNIRTEEEACGVPVVGAREAVCVFYIPDGISVIRSSNTCQFRHFVDCPLTVTNKLIGIFKIVILREGLIEKNHVGGGKNIIRHAIVLSTVKGKSVICIFVEPLAGEINVKFIHVNDMAVCNKGLSFPYAVIEGDLVKIVVGEYCSCKCRLNVLNSGNTFIGNVNAEIVFNCSFAVVKSLVHDVGHVITGVKIIDVKAPLWHENVYSAVVILLFDTCGKIAFRTCCIDSGVVALLACVIAAGCN